MSESPRRCRRRTRRQGHRIENRDGCTNSPPRASARRRPLRVDGAHLGPRCASGAPGDRAMKRPTRAGFVRLVESLATLPYGLEAVDQREHALQTAGLALADGRDDTFVLACALHDIGCVSALANADPEACHEVLGARIVASWLGRRAGMLVRAHVDAKRYLCLRDPDYAPGVASLRSHRKRGDAMSEIEALAFECTDEFADAVALRRYDDRAIVPGAAAPTAKDLAALFARVVR